MNVISGLLNWHIALPQHKRINKQTSNPVPNKAKHTRIRRIKTLAVMSRQSGWMAGWLDVWRRNKDIKVNTISVRLQAKAERSVNTIAERLWWLKQLWTVPRKTIKSCSEERDREIVSTNGMHNSLKTNDVALGKKMKWICIYI